MLLERHMCVDYIIYMQWEGTSHMRIHILSSSINLHHLQSNMSLLSALQILKNILGLWSPFNYLQFKHCQKFLAPIVYKLLADEVTTHIPEIRKKLRKNFCAELLNITLLSTFRILKTMRALLSPLNSLQFKYC